MRLYYSPLACSFAAHVACREANLPIELVRVDLPTKRTALGADLRAENPMGQVPTLVLEDGRVLTENVAVLCYLADRAQNGPTPEDRYELVRWLAFVATELHKKVLAPLYNPAPTEVKDFARASAERALRFVNAQLAARDTLVGTDFSVADAYLFWALTLMPHSGIPLDGYAALRAYHDRHRARPAVRAVYRFEKEQWATPFAA